MSEGERIVLTAMEVGGIRIAIEPAVVIVPTESLTVSANGSVLLEWSYEAIKALAMPATEATQSEAT